MRTKKAIIIGAMGLVALSSMSSLVHAEDDILELDDTANTTDTTTGSDLDLNTTTGDNTTTTDTTDTGGDTLDLGGDDLNVGDTTTDTANTTEQPTYEVVKDKDNAVKFDVLIQDPKKSYAVKFATGTEDLSLVNLVINNNDISDNLKNSLSFVIKKADGTTETIKATDVDVKPVDIPKDAEVYLVYNPDGVDNTSELSLSDNKLNIYAEQIRVPAQEGELNYANGNLELVNPVDYKEATVDYQVKPELVKDVKTKTALTKKDTGPTENVLALILGVLFIIVGSVMLKKSKSE